MFARFIPTLFSWIILIGLCGGCGEPVMIPAEHSLTESTGSGEASDAIASRKTPIAKATVSAEKTQPTKNTQPSATSAAVAKRAEEIPSRMPIAMVLKPEDTMEITAVSADGRHALFPKPSRQALREVTLRLVEVDSDQTVWERDDFISFQRAVFDPMGRYIFVLAKGTKADPVDQQKRFCHVLDPRTGKTTKTIAIKNYLNVVGSGESELGLAELQHTGDRIVVLYGPGITLIDARSGEVLKERNWDWPIKQIVKEEPGVIHIDGGSRPAYVPNSGSPTRVVISNNPNTISAWEIDQPEPKVLFSIERELYGNYLPPLAILPDGKRRITKDAEYRWAISNMDGSQSKRFDISGDSATKLVGVAANSNNVFFRAKKHGLVAIDVDTQHIRFKLAGKPDVKRKSFYEPYILSADGSRLFAKRREADGKTYFSVWNLK